MTQKERKLRIVFSLMRVGDVFFTGLGGSPSHPGEGPPEEEDELHGIQTESGIDITTEGGVIIQAENQ